MGQHGYSYRSFSGDLAASRPVESGEPEVIKYTNLIRNFIIADEVECLLTQTMRVWSLIFPHIKRTSTAKYIQEWFRFLF